MNTIIAGGVFVSTVVIGGAMMLLPLTIDGMTCNHHATPAGVNHDDLDAKTAAELEAEGVPVSIHECRDALRTRYVGILGGFILVNALAAGVVSRKRPLALMSQAEA